MGESNSSVTRVWPLFETLLSQDESGTSWLPRLLQFAPNPSALDPGVVEVPGTILDECRRVHQEALERMREGYKLNGANSENAPRACYESALPPPQRLLRYLMDHYEELAAAQKQNGTKLGHSEDTIRRRRRLLDDDPAMLDEARRELDKHGAMKSKSKWWAFEGFTSVDVRLETERLVLLIEGKRKEEVSRTVSWMLKRDQVARNLDVAQHYASKKRKVFAVLLCQEHREPPKEEEMLASLPHQSVSERKELLRHFLGAVTWSDLAKALLPGFTFPNTVSEAARFIVSLHHAHAG